MLTDKEADRIHAEHEALSGTKPDGYSWAFLRDIHDQPRWMESAIKEWRERGMKWLRVTRRDEDQTMWVEVWKEVPEKEAPFNPPYVAG
jgi:hypothetical protein